MLESKRTMGGRSGLPTIFTWDSTGIDSSGLLSFDFLLEVFVDCTLVQFRWIRVAHEFSCQRNDSNTAHDTPSQLWGDGTLLQHMKNVAYKVDTVGRLAVAVGG